MIPRKWEWIKDQCVRRGFKDAAKLAGEIDDVLLDLYNMKHTKDWKVFCECTKMDEVATRTVFFYVVGGRRFCVACQVSKMLCGECSFAKKCGRCTDYDSLFGRVFGSAAGSWFKPNITSRNREG